MDTSKFLSKVIGIYLLIISIAMFVNTQQFTSYVNALINDTPLMFVVGFFTLILGILMVVSHNIWQWNWRVLITLIAWITLLKGASIIFYPYFIDSATIVFLHNMTASYVAMAVDFILGLILCYFGFKREFSY